MTGHIPPFHASPVCDFCLAPEPRYSYDPRAGTAHVGAESTDINGQAFVIITNDSPWSACVGCSAIIDARETGALALRAARLGLERMGLFHEPVNAYARKLHKLYSELLPTLGTRRDASQNDHDNHARGPRVEEMPAHDCTEN